MIGDIIYKFRKQEGLTLTELAERANVSKSYLSNIERNLNKNPSIQIIEKISDVLQIEPSELIKKERPAPLIDDEWIQFMQELKDAGIKIEDIRENMKLIEFIKWRRENK